MDVSVLLSVWYTGDNEKVPAAVAMVSQMVQFTLESVLVRSVSSREPSPLPGLSFVGAFSPHLQPQDTGHPG